MKGEERRKQLLKILSSSTGPVSGGTLSQELHVSRQIIVQDISLLRANGSTIFSTNKGYLLQEEKKYSRVFKVYHTDDQVEEELSAIVDAGGQIRDVFVYHKVYGVDAESEEILDTIQEELRQRGFLAKLQDYEPVDFWGGQG